MTVRPRGLSLRARLTLSSSAALAVLLAAYAVGVFLFFRDGLHTELDRRLDADIELGEDLLVWTGSGAALVSRVPTHDDEPTELWLEAWSPVGSLLYRSPLASREPIEPVVPARDLPNATTGRGPGQVFRVRERKGYVEGKPVLFRAAQSENVAHAELARIAWILAIGLPLGAIGAAAAGYRLAGRALAPVDRLAARAAAITIQRLGERLPVESPDDELGRLAKAFNVALERLERSFDQMQRFTSDASHELRTPLTAMRSVGEVGLQQTQTPARYREIIGSMLEEVDRLSQLVDTLLMLSRADAGETMPRRERVELGSLVDDAVAQLSVLAEEKGQTIRADLDHSVTVSVDPILMRRAIANVLDNAIKYSSSGTTIHLTLGENDQRATLSIRDEGPGIPPNDMPHIFDRFFRVDRARSRETPGVGLGLAIAQSVVQAHGGSITVDSVEDQGSTFNIRLPI